MAKKKIIILEQPVQGRDDAHCKTLTLIGWCFPHECQLRKVGGACGVLGAVRNRGERAHPADPPIAKMLLSVALISVCLLIFIYKYAFGSSGPNPFETDSREPLKKMIHDRKEKNKVLKQGELKDSARGRE